MSQENNIAPPAGLPPLTRANTTESKPNTTIASASIPSQHIIPTPLEKKSDLSYEIKGTNSQFIELVLRPGQSLTGEISALMYYEAGINIKMRMGSSVQSHGDGFFNKLLGLGKAAAKGHRLFVMSFTNSTQKELKIAFSMPYSGTVVPIELSTLGNRVICQESAFLCATSDLHMSSATSRDFGGSFLNAAISLQKIEGRGTLFLFCGGSVMQRDIKQGEAINVTTGTTLAFQPGVILKIKTIRNVGITGQGHMLTELSGSGRVWLQSLPVKRLNDNIINNIALFFGIKQKKKNAIWGKKK